MNIRSLFDSENIYWVSQILLVAFAGIALVSGGIVNRRQKRETLELKTKLSEADTKASKAQESAFKADFESSQLKLVVAQAEEKRAIAERELLKLQNRFAPRTLSAEQRAKFAQLVRRAPKGKVKISATAGNNESRQFAEALKEMFSGAGYEVDQTIHSFMSTGTAISGIGLKIQSPDSQPPHAGPLQIALNGIGVPAPGGVEAPVFNLPPDEVIIYVYTKE